MKTQLILGDCLDKLKDLEDNSVDSIVTDPPYGLSFMGKKWDYDVPSTEIWEECIRVLKPGGHLLSFAGSRTYHRMAVRIEDAGFEIRDQIMWVYGSGFPKSHNIGKSIDKKEGNEREVVGKSENHRTSSALLELGFQDGREEHIITKGNSDWEGWGTALKPAHEPIVMARKPLIGTVADNVLEYGVGGINIDGCRIGVSESEKVKTEGHIRKGNVIGDERTSVAAGQFGDGAFVAGTDLTNGRFPANIIFECTCDNPKIKENTNTPYNYNENEYKVDGFISNIKPNAPSNYNDTNSGVIHTDPNCPCYILDQQSGKLNKQAKCKTDNKSGWQNEYVGGNEVNPVERKLYLDEGGASRFFYCPKTSRKDRNEGMPEEVGVFIQRPRREDGSVIYKETHPEEWAEAMKGKHRSEKTSKAAAEELLQDDKSATRNIHPTVKPTDLMAYLIRLVTPKGGVVLDPFMGSGSTGKAAVREGMEFIGIEREEEYFQIAKQRINAVKDKTKFWC